MTQNENTQEGEGLSRRDFATRMAALIALGDPRSLVQNLDKSFLATSRFDGELGPIVIEKTQDGGTRASYATRVNGQVATDLPVTSYEGSQQVSLFYLPRQGGERIERTVTFAPFIKSGDANGVVSSVKLTMDFEFGEERGERREDILKFACELNGEPLKSFTCRALRPNRMSTPITEANLRNQFRDMLLRLNQSGGHLPLRHEDSMEFVGIDPAYKR